MKKKKMSAKLPKKAKKSEGDTTTTSINFKKKILEGIKKHPLHEAKSLSVSWIVNQLCAKFLAGEVVVEYP